MTLLTPPSALAAVHSKPTLHRQVALSLASQGRRVRERTTTFIPPIELIRELDDVIQSNKSGLILIEGPAGVGATSLLCHLAATSGYPFWLPDDDAGSGLEALCAQILALYDLPLPLVPPEAGRDSMTLERILGEAAIRARGNQPIVVLIDQSTSNNFLPNSPPLPAISPPGVVIVHTCQPGCSSSLPLIARITLPMQDTPPTQYLIAAARKLGCVSDLASEVAWQSEGSFLYVRLASGFLKTGLLHRTWLPRDLTALYRLWWQQLDKVGQRLAQILAAAGEPIDSALCAELVGTTQAKIERFVHQWKPLLEISDDQLALYHHSTREFIAEQSADNLAAAHDTFVTVARSRSASSFEALDPQTDGYFMRQVARHLALSYPKQELSIGSALMQRPWILAQERRTGNQRAAARDAAWYVYQATRTESAPQLVRAAALAGTLSLLSRSLSADGLVEAFTVTLQRGENREATLRRARTMVDALPGGRDKAAVLRQLGEVCYEQGMRSQAMRMLSEALDLEVPGLPRKWRDEREETLVAFARVAISISDPDMALGITTRISHAERRGLIETEVVRWLLARNLLTRAEEVAYAIGHEHTHEWAMAEVAVGHARANNITRAEEVLSTLKTETAVVWARTELASDAARQGDVTAIETIAALANKRLRERAMASVAQALVAGNQPEDAILATGWIEDPEMRVRALIDVALLRPLNAKTVLEHAANELANISGSETMPLVIALATAQVAIGDVEGALRAVPLLTEQEERNRALSRVAVALARRGEYNLARRITTNIPDQDERFWTLHELARQVAEDGDWRSADLLVNQIGDADVRTRAEADLCIIQAHAGRALLAQKRATLIVDPAQRVRAYIAIADALVQQGGAAKALHALEHISSPDARSRYQAALAAALATHGKIAEGRVLAQHIVRPFERARALIAIARAAVPDAPLVLEMLGHAFQVVVALGRTETFTCLTLAAEPLVALGGAETLLAAAHALDEIDSWWA